MRRAALSLLVALSPLSPAFAELSITHASPRRVPEGAAFTEAADVEVHTHLLLRGVEFYGRAEAPYFRLPTENVRALSQSLNDQILDTLKTHEYVRQDFPASDIYFVVGYPRRLAPTGLIAEVEVVFRGELSVTFGVLRAGSGYSPVYPARTRANGRVERLFDIMEPVLRRRVEDEIDRRCREQLK